MSYSQQPQRPRRGAVDLSSHPQVIAEGVRKWEAENRTKSTLPRCRSVRRYSGISKAPGSPALCHFISFQSSRDSGQGVPFTSCLANPSETVLAARQPITFLMPIDLQTIVSANPRGELCLDWEGYRHLNFRQPFAFTRPDRTLLTVGEVAHQVARTFKLFYDKHHQDFQGQQELRLGPNYAKPEHIRLVKLYLDAESPNVWRIMFSF